MGIRIACVTALTFVLGAGSASADGLLGGLRESVQEIGDAVREASDAVSDLKGSKEELEDTIGETKELLPDSEWRAAPDGQQVALTGRELGEQIESGRIRRDTLVWTKGMKDWRPAGELGALAGHFAKQAPEIPDVAEGPPPLPDGPPPLPKAGRLEDQL